MTCHVRLLKMSWLIAHHKARKILMRRQELPEEAFISVNELQRLYGTGNGDGVLPIIAISFCWLTPAHPDPAGEQLAIVAAALEHEQEKYSTASRDFLGFQEMGVFWDWGSIYQKDPALFNPQETPEAKPEADGAAGLHRRAQSEDKVIWRGRVRDEPDCEGEGELCLCAPQDYGPMVRAPGHLCLLAD